MLKLGQIVALLLALVLSRADAAAQEVAAFIENPHNVPMIVLAHAKSVASGILRTASVRLEWLSSPPPDTDAGPGGPVVVGVEFQSSKRVLAGVLAYTRPYASANAKITVIYDNLGGLGKLQSKNGGTLLGHVIAHEITHVLQRVRRHSDSGLMKAHWDWRDYAEMEQHPLPFTEQDIQLIQLGLASWRRQGIDLTAQLKR